MTVKNAWRMGLFNWLLLAISLLLTGFIYWGGVEELIVRWNKQEEYSHGYLIPVLTIYFIWLKKNNIALEAFKPSWWGFIIVIFSLTLYFIGEMSALFIFLQYSLILLLIGLSYGLMGWPSLKHVLMPIGLLIFAIPMPYFIEANLSANLQLISTRLGVEFIRLCQIPVYMEGNLIDLGVYRLEVIEACSGLRYLFPLMSIGVICAYLFKVELWKRITVFLTTIPITILMNSFRIGMIGVLVDNWGSAMAEGFIHDFEGWVVFMACLGILLLEMFIINKLGKNSLPFMDVFGIQQETEMDFSEYKVNQRELSIPLASSVVLLLIVSIISINLVKRQEIIPARTQFSKFPMTIDHWHGERSTIEANALKTLDLSDYIIADFTNNKNESVNFYSAYYASQRKGSSPHSPRVCIPGGGWKITEIKEVVFNGFPINRITIKKGEDTQLVYYWFQERGRQFSDEYLMKWYLFEDALLLNRTDGALVRLTTFVKPNEQIENAENRLQDMANLLLKKLPEYIPN